MYYCVYVYIDRFIVCHPVCALQRVEFLLPNKMKQ